jgi:hypothetical protein
MKAALYALHYIYSTHDYGISFTSDSVAPMHSYIHVPPSTDVEAYTDALPPTLATSPTLSSYVMCVGVCKLVMLSDGTALPLFKFRSMFGGIIFWNGGPAGWLGERQDCTSLSSCEAEIRATNATSKKVVDFCNICQSMVDSGHNLNNIISPTLLFNNNDACVKWSYNMTSKAACHIGLWENSVKEWSQSKLLLVKHVYGKLNLSHIFMKEMRDGTHFRRLWDSFMSRLSDFVNVSLLAVHHGRRWRLLPFRLLLMPSSRKALSPTFQLLLLPLSADLFRLYLTSPVLVDTSFDVFTDLFPWVSHSTGFYWRFGVLLFFVGCFGFFSRL